MSGLVREIDDVLTEYLDPERDTLWQLALPVIREVPVEQAATGAGVSERTINQAHADKLTGTTARAIETRTKLTDYTIKHARTQLRAARIRPPINREALLATYLDHQRTPNPEPQLCACGCGQPVKPGRRGPAPKWHSDKCRKRHERARLKRR